MFLRQGTNSIEDYVVDFLELAHLTHLDEICLMIFFRGGLSEPLSSIMPLHDSNWTLDNYSDIALQLSGSPFTVGIAEEENNSPVVTSTPEPCHKMAANPETLCKMAIIPMTFHKMTTSPEMFHKMFHTLLSLVPSGPPILSFVPS